MARQRLNDSIIEDGRFEGIRKITYARRSGAGASNLLIDTELWTSTGASQVVTLADGIDGQVKTFVHEVDGGSLVITPTNMGGAAHTTVTLVDAGDSITLRFMGGKWWLTATCPNTEGTPLVIA